VYRWRREAAGRPARKSRPQPARFVPLLVEDGSPVTEPASPATELDRVEVVLRNDRLMRFGSTVDPDGIARLAAALER
jgi:hypothetical protein